MTRPRRAVRALLATALAATAALPATAGAQDPPTTAAPVDPTGAAAAASATAGTSPATFDDLGFGDRSVHGVTATTSFFVPLAAGFTATAPSTLDLDLRWSPLLLPDLSSVTVAAGGVSLQSVALTPDFAAGRRLTVTIPPDLVGEDGVFLEARFRMRATRDDCEDPTNPALWATVLDTSRITLGTSPAPRDLADLRELLAPRSSEQVAATLAVPDTTDADLLAAAAATAFQLGRWAAADHRDAEIGIQLQPLDATWAVATPTVVVGTRKALSGAPAADAALAGLPSDATRVVGLGQAGAPLLAVSGRIPAEVRRAAVALADPGVERSLSGPVAVLGDAAPRSPRRAAPWTKGAASFAQLGIGRQELAGVGRQVLDLVVERPAGWQPDRTATLTLRVDAGAALRDTSSVQVTAGGIDLGTQRLRPADGVQSLSFEVPGDQLDRELDGGPRRDLDLRLTFDLTADQQRCTPVDVDAVRVSVLPDSRWQVPHTQADALDVGRFPFPLLTGTASPEVAEVAVVLPDGADATTTAAGLQLVAAMGRWAEPGAPVPTLVRANDLGGSVRDTTNLVLLGDADDDLGRPVEVRGPVASPAGQASAVLALAPSPFDEDLVALVVRGDAEGLLLAARSLATRDVVDDLRGAQVALVGAVPQALLGAADATPPASLAPIAPARTDRGRLLVGAVLLGAFLATILVVVWFRWIRPRRRRA